MKKKTPKTFTHTTLLNLLVLVKNVCIIDFHTPLLFKSLSICVFKMSSGSGTVNARIVVQRAGHSSPIPYSDTSSKGRNSPCAPAPLTPPSHVSSDLHHTPKKFSHSKAATLVPLATRMPTQPGDECSSPLPLSSPSNGIATMCFGRREPSHSSHSPSLPEPEELGARRNKVRAYFGALLFEN